MTIKQTLRRSMTKSVILVAFTLTSVFTAAADTSVYNDITKHRRGDNELLADGNYCDQKVGETPNHALPTTAYKKCMLSRGYRFIRQRGFLPSRPYRPSNRDFDFPCDPPAAATDGCPGSCC